METDERKDPILDPERLAEIARLGLNQDFVDDELDALAQQAAEELNLPTGIVSIVLDGVQNFAASYGLKGWIQEVKGTPVEWAFCANSVRSEKEYIVEDAEKSIMRESPLVQMEGVRCYAGVPLITTNGHIIGNFCVQGTDARKFSDKEISRLKQMASKVMEYLESRAHKNH